MTKHDLRGLTRRQLLSRGLSAGARAMVGAKSGVMRDVPDGERVLGIPAAPDKQAKRQWIGVQQLPDMIRQLRELERQVRELKEASRTAPD